MRFLAIILVMAITSRNNCECNGSGGQFDLTKARPVIETAMGVVLLRLMAMLWALSPIEGH